MNNNSILSLFSGGGFLDMGFLNQGFQIESAVEIEKNFVDVYNSAIKNYVLNKQLVNAHADIAKPIDISDYYQQDKLSNTYAGISGIIGGPPCQDYSIGGKNKGSKGDRGKLIYSYFLTVKKVQPEFIFFENVAGLHNTKNHQLAFLDFVEKLEKDYHVWYTILNALEYGVPQDRSRIALVGFKKSIVRKLLKNGYKLLDSNGTSDELFFRWPKKRFSNPKKAVKWPSKWEFGSGINYYEKNKIPDRFLPLTVSNAFEGLADEMPNQLETFEPYSKKFKKIEEGDTYRKSFKRLHRFKFSPTVAYGNNEVHLHPTEPRRLSVREALRLQTVPDGYIMPKESFLTTKFKIIGNGVPTKLAELIAIEINRTLTLYHSLK